MYQTDILETQLQNAWYRRAQVNHVVVVRVLWRDGLLRGLLREVEDVLVVGGRRRRRRARAPRRRRRDGRRRRPRRLAERSLRRADDDRPVALVVADGARTGIRHQLAGRGAAPPQRLLRELAPRA